MARLCCWSGVDDVPVGRIYIASRASPGIFRYTKSNNPFCVVIGATTKEEAAEAVFDDSTYYQANFGDFEEVKDEIVKDLHGWIEPPPY